MQDKKQRLTQTALKLFYENGIHAVGINEVLAVSGVAKKTLYNHFKSKDELILTTLKLRDEHFLRWLTQVLSGSKDNQELITRLFTALTAWFKNDIPELAPFRGCYFINTSAEFSNSNNEIMAYCQSHKAKVKQLIKEHMPKKNTELLDSICLLKEGAIISAFLNNDPAAAKQCIAILSRFTE